MKDYDDDENGVIDILELIKNKNREKLANDLSKENKNEEGEKENSQLRDIINAIKKLENEITKYRQGTTNKENTEQKAKHKRQRANSQLWVITNNQADEIKTQVEVLPRQN